MKNVCELKKIKKKNSKNSEILEFIGKKIEKANEKGKTEYVYSYNEKCCYDNIKDLVKEIESFGYEVSYEEFVDGHCGCDGICPDAYYSYFITIIW